MERRILNEDELASAVAQLDGWNAVGNYLTKRLEFPNFAESLTFVNKAADLAEAADHHPDITFGWGYVELKLTTHDRGGVTDVDITLAGQVDSLG